MALHLKKATVGKINSNSFSNKNMYMFAHAHACSFLILFQF